MPKIPNPKKGEPLKVVMLKADRDILANAAGLWERMRGMTAGFNPNLGDEFLKLKEKTAQWAETEEFELKNPPF